MTLPKRPFIPARPSPVFIKLAQHLADVDLKFSNTVHIDDRDLDVLRKLPAGAGVILTPNHADETDPRLCFDISRRLAKRFSLMCNREAFDEWMGMAGWALSRLGLFSVERGVHDNDAKEFAIDVIKRAQDVLVIFPEGEIFYLNESVQPFHSGAVELAMQAIIARRKEVPDWTTYIVPMAIKYSYEKPIQGILERRVEKLEQHLSLPSTSGTIEHRLKEILRVLLLREEQAHNLTVDTAGMKLNEQVSSVRRAMLMQIEEKYHRQYSQQRRTIDASWELSASLRDLACENKQKEAELRADISELHEVAQMVSWQPKYFASNPSADRLAEVVLKLEREYYRQKRPQQLAKRNAFVRIAEPIDLGQFLDDYQSDPHSCRNKLTLGLHDCIQTLIDNIALRF